MIFFNDFETTGLVKEGVTDFVLQPGIVQIGACVVDPKTFKIVKRMDTLINPEISEQRWEAGAIKTHGITPAMTADAPTFFAIFDEFASLAEGCDTWGGYNTPFDQNVLWFQLLRYGFERRFPWPRKDMDVMRLASHRMTMEGKRGTKRPKLTEVYEHLFKKPLEAAHNALKDTEATVAVAKELLK